LPRTFTGSGDVTAAIFLAAVLRGWKLPRILAHTAAVIYGVLKITNDLGRTELALISAQDELIHPSRHFEPVRVR
jgi:pyridoxine kinase